MGGCGSKPTNASGGGGGGGNAPAPPMKPPKPGGSMSTLPAKADMPIVTADPPVAPPKPRALQGKDGLSKAAKGEFRAEDDKKEIVSMVGPSKGPSCITIPNAREEVAKDTGEKYTAYTVVVKLQGNKTHSKKFRYSEFATFHREWQKEYPGVNIDMPKKLLSASDEDIARRCVELQVYLREMCEVAALVYAVAKFLGVEEPELKAAIKGGRATEVADGSGPAIDRKRSGRQLPKIRLDTASNTTPPSTPPVHRINEVREPPPPVPPPKPNAETPKPVAAPPPPEPPKAVETPKASTPPPLASPPPVSSPKATVAVSKPAEPTRANTTNNRVSTPSSSYSNNNKPSVPVSRKDPEPVKGGTNKVEPVKGALAGQKSTGPPAGAGGASVKDRMAAFQKGK